jgi:PPP family 3-phenylpropionic acid transporter
VPRRIFLRFSLAQAAPSLVGGVYVPFFPLWLAHQGMSPSQMSFVFAACMFTRVIVSPIVGIAADALGDRRAVAMACVALSTGFFIALGLAGPVWGFAAILPLMILATPLNSATSPIIEGVTARGAIDYRFDYAQARMFGSLAFVAGNYFGGVAIGVTGPGAIVWIVTVAVAACFLAFLPLPPLLSDRRGTQKRPMGKALRRTFSEARVLLKKPVFRLFLAATALAQASHAVFYTFGTLTFRGFGYSDDYIGFLWAAGTMAEVLLFAFQAYLFRRWTPTGLIVLGAAIGVVRWIGMAFDTGPVGALVLQLGHAATFGLVHLGTMRFLALAVPVRLTATGQSLFAVIAFGLVMGIVTLASGWLYETTGPHAYLFMAALSLAALALTLALSRAWSGRNLFAFNTGRNT